MKQGKPVITFVILVLAAALAVYLGFYAFGALNEPFTTTLAYQYSAARVKRGAWARRRP